MDILDRLKIPVSGSQIFTKRIFSGVFTLFTAGITGFILSRGLPLNFKIAPVVIISIGAFLIIHPLAGVMSLLLLRPELILFRDTMILPVPGGNILGVISFSTIILLFIVISQERRFSLNISRIKYLVLMLSVSILGLIQTADLINYIPSFLRVLSIIALYLLIYNLVKTRKDGLKIQIVILLSTLIPMMIGFYQILTGHTYVTAGATQLERMASTFSLANSYTRFLLFAGLGSLSLLWENKRESIISKRIISLIFGLIFLSIILAKVRSTWCIILGLSFLLSFFISNLRRFILVLLPLFLISFSSYFMAGFEDILHRPKTAIYGDSIFWRFEMWRLLLTKVVPQHPIIGFGLGSAKKAAIEFGAFSNIPHNDYLRILIESGLLGVLFFILFIFSTVRHYLHRIKRESQNLYLNVCAFSMIVCFSILSFFVNMFYDVTCMWYVFAFFAVVDKLNFLEDKRVLKV